MHRQWDRATPTTNVELASIQLYWMERGVQNECSKLDHSGRFLFFQSHGRSTWDFRPGESEKTTDERSLIPERWMWFAPFFLVTVSKFQYVGRSFGENRESRKNLLKNENAAGAGGPVASVRIIMMQPMICSSQ